MSPNTIALMSLDTAALMLPGLIIGLSLHEFAHAWSASLLGDNFSRRQGRVSLNPFRHLSILGTLALFVIGFGWGKPVEVNLYNFKHPKRDFLITSLAGPLANVILMVCFIALTHLSRHDYSYGAWAQPHVAWIHELLIYSVIINAILATLNMLPIPPLDGSKIWPCLIPGLKPSFGGKMTWIFIIAILFLMRSGSLDSVFGVVIRSVAPHVGVPDSSKCEWLQEDGEEAYDEDKLEAAERCFSEVISLHPSPHSALHWRAATRLYLNKLPEALKDIDRAIAIHGDNPDLSETRTLIVNAIEHPSQPASQPASQPVNGE
jgi:Zn-dependent protease